MQREKRIALALAISFATSTAVLGLILIKMGVSDSNGEMVFVPGTLVEIACLKLGMSGSLSEAPLHIPFVLGFSWLFYFTAFYLYVRWRLRRAN
jgi:hypothetical protein